MITQAPRPPVQRSQAGVDSDLPGGSAKDFTVNWVHAYGVMRIEVRGGQVYVDGEVVRSIGRGQYGIRVGVHGTDSKGKLVK